MVDTELGVVVCLQLDAVHRQRARDLALPQDWTVERGQEPSSLDAIALELEIANVLKHGTLEQIREAEARRASLRKR